MRSTYSAYKTLELLRRRDYLAGKVEKYIHQKNLFQDLFGLYDIVAINEEEGFFLIQSTEVSAASAHRKKMLEDPVLVTTLKAGVRVQLWTVIKIDDGSERLSWDYRIEEASLNSDGVPEFREAKVPANSRQKNRKMELDYCI